MNVITHVLPDALISSPLVSGGGLSATSMSLNAVVASALVQAGEVTAPIVMPSASTGTFNTAYTVDVVFEIEGTGGAANIFRRKDGTLVAVTDEGEQVQIGVGSANG